MNQYDSYRLPKRIYIDPSRLAESSFQQYKSISSHNLSTKTWNSNSNESSTTQTPLFIKSPFKSNNNFQIRFLKDTDQLSSAQNARISLYGSLLKNNSKPDFISHSHENFATSSHKLLNRAIADNSLKKIHLYNNLQSKPSSANNVRFKITNLTIKQSTIDMSEQLSMIPEVNESSYILNEKAKMIAKLIEKNSNLKIENLEDRSISARKKPTETSNSKLAICQLKSLDLNLDLEKNLKLADDSTDQYFNNNVTLSYPNLNSSSCYFNAQKFNTKLDRQFKRVTPSLERNKKNVSTISTSTTYSNRAKSSKKPRDESANVLSLYREARKCWNAERPSMTSEIKGTSIKLITHHYNSDNSTPTNTNNNNNKTSNFENNYCTSSLIDFT